jgi:hypothetical protein
MSKFWCWSGINKYNLSFVQMREKTIFDSPCFLTLIGSKANTFNDNPCD